MGKVLDKHRFRKIYLFIYILFFSNFTICLVVIIFNNLFIIFIKNIIFNNFYVNYVTKNYKFWILNK